ncbi:NUDIX hydrolase [Halobacillus litoralis]|uniref:NUDIX hydrolase n=2 Tax=Halobacillus litoralis TaxID=45668 RepID=A0A410MDY8_9BACI|nr:NUDIX hydrolase [Halobacillus litoralis]
MEMDVRFQVGKQRFNFRSAGILIENGHVLLHKEISAPHWVLPGGGIEMGEPSEESIVREMKEELGYAVKAGHVPWIAENFFEYEGEAMHELGFYYILTSPVSHFQEGVFHGLEGERLIYQWLPIDRLENYELMPPFLTGALKDIPEATKHVLVQR